MFTIIRYSTAIFTILCLFPQLGFSQNEPPVVLDELIAETLQRNPSLLAAEYRWQASQQRRPQVSTLDDPMFSYTRWARTPETRVGPQENVFMLSQRIPYPGKRGLKGDMADQEAAAQEAQWHATARDMVLDVKRIYYELYRVDQSIRILNDYLSVLRTFTRVAEEKYVTGAGIQANILKSQVEISTIIERRLSFERIRAGLVPRLNALRDRPADMPIGMAVALPAIRYTVPESLVVQQALTGRQELQTIDARIQKSEIMTRLARLAFRPDFNIQATYITIPKTSNQPSDAGKDAFGIMFGLNIPIRRARRHAAVEEAQASMQAHQMTRQHIVNGIQATITDIYAQMKVTGQTLDLYDQGMLVQAESSLESALSAYQTGKLDFLNLLDAERMLLQLKLGYIKEQAAYQKQVANLEWAAGGKLPEGIER